MSIPRYHVFIRDRYGRRLAELDTFTTATFKPRFNQVGFWQLTVPVQERLHTLLVAGNGIIVTRNDLPLISGPMRHFRRQLAGATNTYELSGPDDLVWFNDHLAAPVPGGPPYAGQEADIRQGAAETVIKGYVSDNAGPTAPPARQVPGLTLAPDQHRGLVISGRARFVNLLTLITDLALSGGDLGCQVRQGEDTLIFDTYQTADRSDTTVFSVELGTLDGFDYVRNNAQTNYIIAGGQGEGILRTFAELGDTDSIAEWGRIETFLDRRDVATTTELVQAIATALSEHAEQYELQVTPALTDALQFGRDFSLGDRVTVRIDGETIQDVIREVGITLDAQRGEIIAPVIGTPGMRHRLGFFSRFSHLQAQLSLLQRR